MKYGLFWNFLPISKEHDSVMYIAQQDAKKSFFSKVSKSWCWLRTDVGWFFLYLIINTFLLLLLFLLFLSNSQICFRQIVFKLSCVFFLHVHVK